MGTGVQILYGMFLASWLRVSEDLETCSMLPRRPQRSGQLGFLYLPPYRVQGISYAGEQTAIHVPELDVSFDVGLCPKPVLAAPFIALTHGHMDHVAGLPYYFSQRMFQKMGVGTCVCHEAIAGDVQLMMSGWVGLEQQHTPHKIIPLEPGGEIEIKPNIMLRGIEASHTVPAMSYVVVEYRKKLKERFHNLPQDQLRGIKKSGENITDIFQIPLVACTGDTEMGEHLGRPEFRDANIVITECTFFEEDNKDRARVGKHLHIDHIVDLLKVWNAEHIVITHTSRRTSLEQVRESIKKRVGRDDAQRVHVLMDHRANRLRYEKQLVESKELIENG